MNGLGGKKVLYKISLRDDYFPALLKEISNPPDTLYIKSQKSLKELFKNPCIAVVGTRHITSYGIEVTKKIILDLVKAGFTIVSGLAKGVDYLAHREALNNHGTTIAVLGSGVDRIYPPEHEKIAQEIIKNGALMSEFPKDSKAAPQNFPVRNRIISGLSLGIVVTEAAEKSGTMITASYAAEQGREVFAVPGPITSVYSKGTNSLIKKGAKLVNEVSDILEELQI